MNTNAIYQKEINRISRRIIHKYKPQRIILYGSCAKGNAKKNSDIDILIIKQTSLPRHKRAQRIYHLLKGLKYKLPLEALVYTPQEIKTRLNLGDFFISDIINKGQLIYG